MTAQGDRTRARILEALHALTANLGHPPTIAELAQAVDLSTSPVHRHLHLLAHWGVVKHKRNSPRSTIVEAGTWKR